MATERSETSAIVLSKWKWVRDTKENESSNNSFADIWRCIRHGCIFHIWIAKLRKCFSVGLSHSQSTLTHSPTASNTHLMSSSGSFKYFVIFCLVKICESPCERYAKCDDALTFFDAVSIVSITSSSFFFKALSL